MAPKRRTKENRKLPTNWRWKHGAYYYRVPVAVRHLWEDKSEYRLGTTLAAAHAEYAKRVGYEGKVTTVAQLCDRYTLEVLPDKAPATQRSNQYSLQRLRQVLGHNHVAALRPVHIYAYRDECGKRESKKKANLDLEVLSHMLTCATRWGVVDRNVMTNKGVLKFPLPGRTTAVDMGDLVAFAATAPRWMQLYISLALWTGRRKGELLRLTRFDVTEAGLQFTNNKPPYNKFTLEWEPETRAVVAELLELPTNGGTHLFHTRRGDPYIKADGTTSGFDTAWQKRMVAAVQSGAVKARFTAHDLRKVRASQLTLAQAQELLQHTTPQMTRRYQTGARVVKIGEQK